MAKHTIYYTIEIQGQLTVGADTPAEARNDVHYYLDGAVSDIEADRLTIKTVAYRIIE